MFKPKESKDSKQLKNVRALIAELEAKETAAEQELNEAKAKVQKHKWDEVQKQKKIDAARPKSVVAELPRFGYIIPESAEFDFLQAAERLANEKYNELRERLERLRRAETILSWRVEGQPDG